MPGQEGILNVMFRFDSVDVTCFNERYPALTFWVYVQNATLSTNSAGIVLLDANGAKFENHLYFHNLEGFAYGKWNLVSVDLKPLLTAPGFNEQKISAVQFYYHMSIEDDFVLFLNDFAFTESRAYGVLEQEEIGEFSLVPPTITANLTGGAYSEKFDLTPTLEPAGEATIAADIYSGDKLIETVADAAKLAAYTFLTGGTYTVKYTVTDAFGNVGRAEAQIVVTGTNPAAKPVITVPDSIQKSVLKDYQVNLSAISAVDYAGNALQVSLIVTAPDGSAVTLSAGKFMAAQVGEYIVKATASDGTLSSETTFTITVTEDDSQHGNEGGGGCGGSVAGTLGGLGGLLLAAAAAVLLGRRGKTL